MSMYAVVAPGLCTTYINWNDVERIKRLYPYANWKKCQDEREANEWLRRHSYNHKLTGVSRYGLTFDNLYVDVKYKIGDDCLYIVYDTSRIGTLRLHKTEDIVEYKGNLIYVKSPNIVLSEESISSHMSAIFNLLELIGPVVDVNIRLPYYSLFYALTAYNGSNARAVKTVQDYIRERQGEVSYSMKLKEVVNDG